MARQVFFRFNAVSRQKIFGRIGRIFSDQRPGFAFLAGECLLDIFLRVEHELNVILLGRIWSLRDGENFSVAFVLLILAGSAHARPRAWSIRRVAGEDRDEAENEERNIPSHGPWGNKKLENGH